MLLFIAPAFAHQASLPVDAFPVREKVSIEVQVQVGPEGLQPGDIVVVDEPVFHGMRWSKWGWLGTRPEAACEPLNPYSDQSSKGQVAARAEGVTLDVRATAPDADIHSEGAIEVELLTGELVEGQVLTVLLGTEGDCGMQTADRAMERIPLQVSVFDADRGETELLEPLEFAFTALSEPASVLAVLPSQARVGEAVTLLTVPLDAYGNVPEGYAVEPTQVVFDAPGVYRESVSLEGLSATSNPIRVSDDAELGVYWGDLHTHHGHSFETEVGAWVDLNHRYARDVLGLDFGCESVKARPWEIDGDALWLQVQRSCREYTVDGEYLALLGFEWMGGATEGHHNVYYETCAGPLADMDMPDVASGLWPFMEETMASTGQLMVSIPHAPSFTGFNWTVSDPDLRPVAEVFSEWGDSMDPRRVGSVPKGLAAGQRLGFVGSSDNHDGWLGNPYSEKNTEGGLAAVWMPELTPTDLLESLVERRSYATTGARMILDVAVWEEGQPHRMGEAWTSREARFAWTANGTEEIGLVRLMVAGVGAADPAQEWARWEPGTLDAEGEALIPYGPRDLAVWLEVTQVDREVGWTSPVFLERAQAPEPTGCAGGLPAAGLLALLAGAGAGRLRRARRPRVG